MNQIPSNPSNLDQSRANHQQKDEQSDYSQINENQLELALKAIKKIKGIEKMGYLSAIKSKYKSCNKLFQHMSSFFHKKNKNKNEHATQKRAQKMKLREKQFKSKINSTSLLLNQQNPHQIADLEQLDVQIEPQSKTQILQENEVQLLCHVCRQKYTQIHHFYGYFCPDCASLNLTKRNQTANLSKLTALVTGGRIKIGFQIVLKLLRDGATVYLTSRFPNDCLLRYQKLQDYNTWQHNLNIVQCDFLSNKNVEQLITYIESKVVKLDIHINNAAQTIVRPQEFYSKQIQHQNLCLQFPNQINHLQLKTINNANIKQHYPSVYSNELQIKPEQIDLSKCDEFGQPIDKRKVNSWVQKIQDVSLIDCYTTQVINSIVPFHLISRLKHKMTGNTPSWIINVSSMEGVFNRLGKQQFHPHTNMAKASLNMITRTCASEFKAHQIFMNSVDTGWVTNQNPYYITKTLQQKYKFKCPLDCLDGAMRVLDPIYQGILHNQFPYGSFIKNYTISYW